MSQKKNQDLLKITNLKTHFTLREGVVRSVDGISFTLKQGEVLGVVGESGSGKSITARSIMQLVPKPGKVIEGKIEFLTKSGQVVEITQLKPLEEQMRRLRGDEIAMIFQEPMTCLSPVHTIGNQIAETIHTHTETPKGRVRKQIIELLTLVGMPKPSETIDRFPHQLSGGQRQRAMIAMALSCNPALLIADEPTTALDVTTEAQILDLMRRLQNQFDMAILFITHNLGVVAEMADRVMVMYLGKVVEIASVDDIFYNPKHPYTKKLLESIPRLGKGKGKRLNTIRGMVPDPFSIPAGCPFRTRCDEAVTGVCDRYVPQHIQLANDQSVSCHLYDERMKEAMNV